MAGARAIGGVPRWQLALLLGAPLAIGLGYLYLRNRQRDQEIKPPRADSKGNTVSLDEPKEHKDSPVEKANRFKAQGNHAFREGRFQQAAAFYEDAMKACPPDRKEDMATYYQNRSACHEKMNDWEAVKRDCTAALALNNRYVKAFLRRSRAAERSGDLQMALEDVTAACILERFQVPTTLQLADRLLSAHAKQRAKDTVGTRKPTMPSSYFVKTFLNSFVADPVCRDSALPFDFDPGHFGEARRALRRGDYDKIVSECATDISMRGSDVRESLLLRGTFLFLLGRNDEALEDFSKVADDQTAAVDLRTNALIKRAMLKTQGELKGATNDFETALSLGSDNPDVHHQRGQSLLIGGEIDSAIVHFEKACSLAPDFAQPHVQLAYARYAKKARNLPSDSSDAAPFRELIEKFPKSAEALVIAAEVYSELSDFDHADSLLVKALNLEPNNANVLVHRALMKLKSNGQVEEAVALMEKAISVDDKCLFAYETLGTIEVQRQNLKKAVSLFEKAIELAKTESDMHHLFALKDAACSQIRVSERYGLNVSEMTPA